jgi:uncharacterized protein (DUF1501 family)
VTPGFSRRVFLRGAGLAALGVGVSPTSLIVRAAQAAGRGDSVLVMLFLRGGADGLSICAPYGDPEYYQQRPTIALPRPLQAGNEALIDLDGHFGLHPDLAPLKPLYSEGRLAVLHAVGNASLGRSHFDAQEFVETGTPAIKGTPTGYLGRCIARAEGSDLMRGVSISDLAPRTLQGPGPGPVLVVRDVSRFDFDAPQWRTEAEACLARMYEDSPLPVGRTGRDALKAIRVLKAAPEIGAPPTVGARYPDVPLGASLQQAAQIIKAGLGTRCLFVDVSGDFDTHSEQIKHNHKEYAELGSALSAFDTDLGKHMDRVLVMVVTEFGRAVYESGAQGTDHGTGGAMLLLGGPVKGGRIHGRWPGLRKDQLYLERDLAVTTDFRDAFAEVARKHLGVADVSDLFPGYVPGPGPGTIS